MRTITYTEAIREAYDEEMARDPQVFIMGEDIGKYWGGALGELQGLFDKYGPERIRETPISETAIMGGAIGAAVTGMRPVAWMYFCDFLGVCGDEMINQLTTMRYMFGGKAKVPVTIAVYSGAGVSAAAQHSKCLDGMLMSIPGLKIVAPSTPYDEKGLLKSAIRDDNPVVVSHHKVLIFTGVSGEIPDEEYTIPLGKADIKREGKDVTIVAWALMMHRALEAAKQLEKDGISVEVLDPRTLVPLDTEAILKSVAKTGRLVIVDEEPRTGSAAGSIASVVAEEGFDSLKKPIKLVCAPDTPIPFSPPLEKRWMPNEERIIKAVKDII